MAVQEMKEALCSIDTPPPSSDNGSSQSFALPDGSQINVTSELEIQCRTLPELMFFEPSGLTFDCGYETGVDTMVLDALDACSIDTRKQLLENLVLAGGNSYVRGFGRSLHTRLKEKGGRKVMHLKKPRASKERDTNAWRGACVLAGLSSWRDELAT